MSNFLRPLVLGYPLYPPGCHQDPSTTPRHPRPRPRRTGVRSAAAGSCRPNSPVTQSAQRPRNAQKVPWNPKKNRFNGDFMGFISG